MRMRIEENRRIWEYSQGVYTANFDRKYLVEERTRVPKNLPEKLTSSQDVNAWLFAIPFLKNEMDLWFGRNPKNEREFQQLIVPVIAICIHD